MSLRKLHWRNYVSGQLLGIYLHLLLLVRFDISIRTPLDVGPEISELFFSRPNYKTLPSAMRLLVSIVVKGP